MNLITDFYKRREAKRQRFEREVLVDLQLAEVQKDVKKRFMPFRDRSQYVQEELEEMAVDLGIEAYITGVKYSKFYQEGETEARIAERASLELEQLSKVLYDHWLLWGEEGEDKNQWLYGVCATFIERWWRVGFQRGCKRHRLRLH